MDFAFDTLGWEGVIHCIDPDNAASQRVARRLGSQILRRIDHQAPFEDHVVDVWGQARAQWADNRTRLA